MRLQSLYINDYKNLKKFKLEFDGQSFIDVFVGKNGTGKSNLFEALIKIFQHLYEFDKGGTELEFDYTLKYEIENQKTEISWQSGKLAIQGKERKTIGKTPLPDNVLIYYSGHNETVARLVQEYEDAFRKRIKAADIKDSRPFIGIGPEYKELLLAVLLMQNNRNKAKRFICQKLGVKTVAPLVKLILKRPIYAEGKPAYNIVNNDETDRYWTPKGITKTFLNRLSRCIDEDKGSPVRSEGYFPLADEYGEGDYYILYFRIAKIQKEFNDLSAQELFRQFDNLKTLGLLQEISILITRQDGTEASIAHFSDGQFQSVYIYSIIELFKDRNCITLLDEPDCLLHPEWQFAFLDQVFDITESAIKNNHVLMSSHSAATLCKLDAQNISLFKIDKSHVTCAKRTKKEIVNELSNSFIQYSEDESKLLIDNVIRSSLRPILFVEGPSDVSILNTAYTKLYPNTDIPILIQDAFDRGFIKTLLARHEIFDGYPDKHFFALFDFDDGYDDWRSLGGMQVVSDISLGLCRKLNEKNCHAFLLPIPDNKLRSQVWDKANPIEKIKSKPCFCIEHIFWGIEGLDNWYRTDDKTGLIRFKNEKHKVKFAKEIVPALDTACFEILRPMFDFIKGKC